MTPITPIVPAYEIGWNAARDGKPYAVGQFALAEDRLMYGYGYRDAARLLSAKAAGNGGQS